MTLKRLLAIALVVALLLRLLPVVAPFLWPGWRSSVDRLRRRADIGAAVVMLALTGSMIARAEYAYAALVGLLSIPSVVAAVAVVRGR